MPCDHLDRKKPAPVSPVFSRGSWLLLTTVISPAKNWRSSASASQPSASRDVPQAASELRLFYEHEALDAAFVDDDSHLKSTGTTLLQHASMKNRSSKYE